MEMIKKEFFEKENKIFLKNILSKYSELKNKNCTKQFEAKIAYQSFYNQWKRYAIANRSRLRPYFFIDKRFIVIYLLSFFGLTVDKVLKLVGKNI